MAVISVTLEPRGLAVATRTPNARVPIAVKIRCDDHAFALATITARSRNANADSPNRLKAEMVPGSLMPHAARCNR
jgi:hypothetical protein